MKPYKNRQEFEKICADAGASTMLRVHDEIINMVTDAAKIQVPFWTADESFDKLIFDRKTNEWFIEYQYQEIGDDEPKTYSMKLPN